ncbi:MAG TPA: RtcB family protein [Bacteroidota bacterium]|nr:RtcB family protein [Bacteroidota bacterium]
MTIRTYPSWGTDIEAEARAQMDAAAALPVAVAGALMPDAHVGYGLPIGGVLATDNAVIPYGVGVDIACRMMMTVFDVPPDVLCTQRELYAGAIASHTKFGLGAQWDRPKSHAVMDGDWGVTPVTARLKEKAHRQLGTSGSGNHFVEFVELDVAEEFRGIPRGTYLALLSHSGSRNAGASVASHYTRLAKSCHPELKGAAGNLAWLAMDDLGSEYWEAMTLMGRYASANHHLIHEAIIAHIGHGVLQQIENHHNFAWKEQFHGREVIVHRKGATPAGKGVLGIMPGSMGTPGFLVEGNGNADSLNSTSHGAGRKMSRTAAARTSSWKQIREFLDRAGVRLISAGLDEAPWAYKDILAVVDAQKDLATPVARFMPRLVKMAPSGERPED